MGGFFCEQIKTATAKAAAVALVGDAGIEPVTPAV